MFILLAAFTFIMLPASALSQSTADPASTAQLQLGPFGVTPAIAMSGGVDTNVFNDDQNPEEDWTASLNPQVDVWFRIGPARFEIRNASNFTTFKEYTDQGGFGTRNNVRLDLPLNRTNLFVTQSFHSTRERPGVEIDARVRRREDVLTAGLDIRTTSKTFLRLTGSRALQMFDDEAAFAGISLAYMLNRRTESGTLSLRHQTTALTTLVVLAEAAREKFATSSNRDSESVRVTPGVELDSRALISGRAYVGYRRFIITSGLAPRFTGVVAAVELSSTIRSATRLSVLANRDVNYSYDPTAPYFLMTGGSVSVLRRLGQSWDLTAQIGRQNLDYERWAVREAITGVQDPQEPPDPLEPPVVELPPRYESIQTYGGGIGYRLGDNMRLGVTYDHNRRTSTRSRRPYEGARILTHFTYGS